MTHSLNEKKAVDEIVLRVYPERIKKAYLHEKTYYEIIITKEDIEPLIRQARQEGGEELVKKIYNLRKVCSVEQNEENDHCECMDYNEAINDVIDLLKND